MKMVTTFNTKDMISFGKYLVENAAKREASIRHTFELSESDWTEEDIQRSLKEIHHADLENWKVWKDQKVTRCKFRVSNIEEVEDNGTSVTLDVVVDGSDENKSFWEFTPAGHIRLCVLSDSNFTLGEEYYVDFKKA